MATETGGGPLQRLYSDRIGQPTTGDEVMGYWVFVIGAVLGVLGFLLFVPSEAATGLRELAIVVGALGVPLLIAGPVIRLPLERGATALVALGVAISVAGVAWFALVFPGQWNMMTGNQDVMAVYTLGLLTIATGGIFVPMLSTLRSDAEEAESARDAALLDRDEALAHGEELSRELEAMRERQTGLEEEIADIEADEEDLAAALRLQGASQTRFEVYTGKDGAWRWRLRHHNGRIVADGAQGYSSRRNALKGLRSVRRNALGSNTLLLGADEEPPEPSEGFEPSVETDGERTFAPFDRRLDSVIAA